MSNTLNLIKTHFTGHIKNSHGLVSNTIEKFIKERLKLKSAGKEIVNLLQMPIYFTTTTLIHFLTTPKTLQETPPRQLTFFVEKQQQRFYLYLLYNQIVVDRYMNLDPRKKKFHTLYTVI